MKTIEIADDTTVDAALSISSEKVCYVISKMREFDVKDAVSEPDPGSNAADDKMIAVLEDHKDDSVAQEVTTFIADMNEDEQIDLVALAWLGRDDNTVEDWSTLRREAADAHSSGKSHTARYILGTPLVAQYLEEGLSLFGHACTSDEPDQL